MTKHFKFGAMTLETNVEGFDPGILDRVRKLAPDLQKCVLDGNMTIAEAEKEAGHRYFKLAGR
jgi:hypothetical protein